MARHSHWAQIKLKKGALDKKRGKIFTRHARLIEFAAKKGGEPDMNPTLRIAIENARSDNMPRENIDRAIKKGTGELLEGEQLQEVTYEGFGLGGAAFLVDVLTDNKNRTNQTVRMIFQKHGGSLGSIGSTSFLFETRGAIAVKPKGSRDDDELAMIDAGAEDLEEGFDGTPWTVFTKPSELFEVKKKLEEKGFSVVSAELKKIPKNAVEVTDSETAKKLVALAEGLEEEDDVTQVFTNFDIAENVLEGGLAQT